MSKHNLRVSILMLGFLLWASATAFGQGTAFTYQGKLTDSATPANGQYDFQFKLFDTQTVGTGTQLGTTLTVSNVTVTAGIFTVQLDFGACATCFSGAARFLEIAVKPTSGPTFTTLGPRQPVTSEPYAIRSLNAGNATTADGLSVVCVSCVTSSQIGSVNGSAVSGTIPLASVPSGSANYIQNTTSPQSSSNFNISGNGTAGGTVSANVVNAVTQYNIGGNRVLSAGGFSNLFAGVGAGSVNTGSGNSFFGSFAFGNDAGSGTTSGDGNAFFGVSAGERTSTGNGNAFFGPAAGDNNTIGNTNTAIGNLADVGANNLTNATAIGANSLVSQSNSLVLGSINNVNSADADTSVGIGTTAPETTLDVQREGDSTSIPEIAHFTSYGTNNGILGRSSNGTRNNPTVTPDGRTLLSLGATGHNGLGFGSSPAVSIFMDTAQPWTSTANGTQIRFRTTANDSTTVFTRMIIANDGNVGIGTSTPNTFKLQVAGSVGPNSDGGASLGDGSHRWTAVFAVNGTIQTSDARLKQQVTDLGYGLREVLRLRPVSFLWKGRANGRRQLGLIAQEVEPLIPEVIMRDGNPAVPLGMSYTSLVPVLVKAIKEQQTQIKTQEAAIERQQEQLKQQHLVISSLMKLACADHPQADICK